MIRSTILLLLVFACSPYSGNAVSETQVVGKEEIIRALSQPQTRGIRISPKKTDNEPSATQSQAAAENPSNPLEHDYSVVVLDIKFEFNSSVLSSSARHQLDELGDALSSQQLASGVFEISGHTDSVGSAQYNKHLSRLRADSVQEYLANNFGIAKSKLSTVGYGEEKPLFATDPGNGANRRVEIRRLQ